MKLGIMQPYFFPYIGYFQLIAKCDVFVFLDDVQMTQRSWVTRNRILLDGMEKWLSFSVNKGPRDSLINQRTYVSGPEVGESLSRLLEYAYRNAEFMENTLALFRSLMQFKSLNVAEFNINLLSKLTRLFQIPTEFLVSSTLRVSQELKGQDRLIAICKKLGANTYLNAGGGRLLYKKSHFAEKGLTIRFVDPVLITYPQSASKFVPGLSILDVMMRNSISDVIGLVNGKVSGAGSG